MQLPRLNEVKQERCRKSFEKFSIEAFNMINPAVVLMWNWHLGLICEYLTAVYLRQIEQLIINIAPRHLKSFLCSVSFPDWVLGQKPSEQFICGSYNDKLAAKHSMDSRLLMNTEFYKGIFPGTEIAHDERSKAKFSTTARGHRVAASIGGTSIGEGCNYLVIDDPHNPKKALSQQERTFANEVWRDQSLTSRFNDPKVKREILIMQRLATQDMTGHLLDKEEINRRVHVCLPTRARANEIIRFPISGRTVERKEGALLHPERFGEKEDAQAKVDLGEYGYAGQHDQNPVPLKGGRIKIDWFPRYKELPINIDETVISIDTGNKKNVGNNPSAFSIFQRYKAQWYYTFLNLEKYKYPELKSAVVNIAHYYKPDTILIEDKASGTSLIQDLEYSSFFGIEAMMPEADKLTRMETQIAKLSSGVIALPEKATWLFKLELCLMGYPNPEEWDALDTISQFLKWLTLRENNNVNMSYV